MKLDDLSVVMRPRKPWEACDIGVHMARRWYWPMFKASLYLSLPFLVLVLIALLFFEPYLYLAPIIFWWSKPVWERIHLHMLSQAVFGALPSVRSTVRSFPVLLKRQLFQALIWRRLSLSRAFNAPVTQLEGLGGRARVKRINVLRGERIEPIRWITLIGVHVESFIYGAIYILLLFLIPSELFEVTFSAWGQVDERVLTALNTLIYYLVVLTVMPFYVAAGFALYLNRRAELEGWDIEIAFRKLAERDTRPLASTGNGSMRQGAITACLALVFALGILPQHGMAQEPARLIDSARESADLVSDILNGPEFHVQETVEVPDIDWENFFDWDLGNSWLVDWLSRIFGGDNEIDISFIEVILWALVGILILLLVFHYGSWLQEFGRPRRRGRQTTVTLPTFLQQAGPEVLPDDVPTAARELWQSGDPRQALALLYRASLRHLIERHALPIHAGSTEGECASLVSARTQDATARYFKSLSTSWQLLAYGHIAVANQQFETLAAEWRAAIIEQSLTGAGS